MAKRKGSIINDILDITTMLPWWFGIILALMSYFMFNYIAGLQIEKAEGLDQFGPSFAKQLLVSISPALQYLVPVVFLMGALRSATQRQKKNKLYDHVKRNPKNSSLMEMDWQQFELLVGSYFEKQGYTVRQLAQPGADGGVDLVAIKDGEKYLVQCKQWRSTSVGVKIVRELLGAIAASGAVGGFVVSSGTFTRDAKAFVEGRNIDLIDGVEIVNTIGISAVNESVVGSSSTQPEKLIPGCPKCGSEMVLRTARKGANAGNQFWGCSTFPKCKGTVSV